jgi:hypothetical protein
MAGTNRSAAGPAAGYHYQAQRALLTLIAGSPADGREVAMETLDDLVVSDPNGLIELEQLKHSIRSGALSDRSPALWGALDNWMDHLGTSRMDRISRMILIATKKGAPDSAIAQLRESDRHLDKAEQILLEVSRERPGNAETRAARERFLGLAPRDRGRLLSKVLVRDGAEPVTSFRSELKALLGTALPRTGVEDFLNQLVGWWEQRVVDLLVHRIQTVSYDEVADEISRLRDLYTESELPPADPAFKAAMTKALSAAYAKAPFVHQLELVAAHDERVALAIRDYHRAYAQRSSWLQEGILLANELFEWEERLSEEWERAWVRMLEAVQEADGIEVADAGRALLGGLEDSNQTLLRSGRHRFLHVGTLHGLADARHVGWHRDFEARLEERFGPKPTSRPTSSSFDDLGEGV